MWCINRNPVTADSDTSKNQMPQLVDTGTANFKPRMDSLNLYGCRVYEKYAKTYGIINNS